MIETNSRKALVLIFAILVIATISTRLKADTGTCSGASITLPFVDVPPGNIFFCTIAEAFFLGLTNGTDATHYSPANTVTREQMAAFVTRTMDQSLRRQNRRSVIDQFWTNQGGNSLPLTPVGNGPIAAVCDGKDVWVTGNSNDVVRVRASDGSVKGTWTGAIGDSILSAMGKIFIIKGGNPGTLYQVDPTIPGFIFTLSTSLGDNPLSIAFDGQRLWTVNAGNSGSGISSVSIISLNPVSVINVTTGFGRVAGIVYDGANMWVCDQNDSKIKRLDSSGTILSSASVGSAPARPAFDGTNIWIPNFLSNNITVVRAIGGSAGTVLATLTGNGINGPVQAAFDGERILVTNLSGDSVSLWKATDLTPIGTFSAGAGTHPFGACSDGRNFWVTFSSSDKVARF